MLLQQAIDVLGLGTRASRHTALALAVENFWTATLLRCHRRDNRALALKHLRVDVHAIDLLLDFAHTRHHRHHAAHAAHALKLQQLLTHIVEIEFALAHALCDRLGLLHVDRLCRALDEADNITHAKYSAGDAFWIEVLERVPLFANAEQLDRFAGDRAHR